MAAVPRIVIGPTRFTPVTASLWAATAFLSDRSGVVEVFSQVFILVMALFWIAHYFLCSIVVTDEHVIVRRGMFIDLHRTDAVLSAARGARKVPFAAADQVFRCPFWIRPGLIVEAIEQVRGERPMAASRERALHGRVRSTINAPTLV